ncbi:DEAD/DEAH box helicase [Moritella sp. 5]|uniref:DEAD/DEAH box helicase n=1 Tax=Moritella sp. 5 TaxID=2746231 RepID=UPI001BA5AA62|nr:DEAD/DEAH box helicase [Moritella sp. 5]QUM81405.1 DEAD/DEAH box helicase [Moritella sp. 5]
MNSFFSSLVKQSTSRAKESTLSILGISNPNLRSHLSEQMGGDCGEDNAFLAPPVFEHTFGWEFADPKMSDLSGNLLSADVVNALDHKGNDRYRFGADFNPFKHQLKSWEVLLDKTPKSVVVTSGTGSGKTECFMVPVIDDLYREYKQKNADLVGVRAIFLYPLNALINSQQERLDAWTKHFDTGVRYCLYNGNTENKESKVRQKQKERPNEVLSRELMRKQPAPILVTNGTMLEYMLVRQVDSPIIQKSREEQSLRWIILDEAHTYVGSQAAELALQLRRVLHAFGVEAKNVRFVATSATIADENAEDQLKKYLSELAGVSQDQVVVIGGKRIVAKLDPMQPCAITLEELEAMEPSGEEPKSGKEKDRQLDVSNNRFNALSNSVYARSLRDTIVESTKPLTIDEIITQISTKLNNPHVSQDVLLRWLDVATGTKKDASSEAFLKVRSHFFQRMTQGLWCCIDSNCPKKVGSHLQKNWPFGFVHSTQRQQCECGAPVLELTFCLECNEPHLLGQDRLGKLVQWDSNGGDEFSLQQDVEDEADKPEIQNHSQSSNSPLVFSTKQNAEYSNIKIGNDKTIGALAEGYSLAHNSAEKTSCVKCGNAANNGYPPFRRALLGSPFYVSNVVPTLLEYCPDFKPEKDSDLGPQSLPGRGRRLITFTDSRQGTARMAVRMQQEAERSKLRGLVFEILREAQKDQSSPNCDKVKDEISDLRMFAEMFRSKQDWDKAKEYDLKADKLSEVSMGRLSWREMVIQLANKADIKGSILQYNKYLAPEVFDINDGPFKLAEMMLFREFARRPKRQNSSETQALTKVNYIGLDKVKSCPDSWGNYGFELQDWHDFIKVALDFYIRENTFIQLEDNWKKWIGNKFSSKTLRNPESKEDNEGRVKKWPQINKKGVQGRLAKMLALASKIDLSSNEGVDIVNSWLKSAWMDLTVTCRILKLDGNQFYLERNNLEFSLVDSVFVCPVTNKLFDTTFKSLTPYLPRKLDVDGDYTCLQVDYPQIWDFGSTQEDYAPGIKLTRAQVSGSPEVQALRKNNLWTDINDRAVEGGFYYRTAEHSAQQSSERLDSYEAMFKQGKINVLNCSTTMEMGVDIGGISAVVMNNVPPHPANYLQRAGRAGRSKESRAIAYTLCKNNPHDQQVFTNPKWAFETVIPAPYVAFNSIRLVQRHVNSMLLSIFLREEVGTTSTEKTTLNLEWFYVSDEQSICEKFKAWILADANNWNRDLKALVRGTALAHETPEHLRSSAVKVISTLEKIWLAEFNYLNVEKTKALKESPYEYRLKLELSRLTKEYLLRELASKSFLPGYGFPTDVVNFDNNNIEDYIREKNNKSKNTKDREDNVSRVRGLPSRNLAVAIREYAPGAEIVLDGRVFRSGGIALNWLNIANNDAKEAQKFDLAWRCDHCGQTGFMDSVSIAQDQVHCDNLECGQQISPKNQRRVLQPTGFVTNFHESPSNDITAQKYLPVEPAWVSVSGDKLNLPNLDMGYMVSGANGTIFHHTSGEFGKGYALCMTCGKAESLDYNGDYPKHFSPFVEHKPLKAGKKDKNESSTANCEGSANLMRDVHLGCHSKTDVFELVLKHPKANEYIAENSDNGRSIAMTLAVSLRAALAKILGISTSELGYACRPAIVADGQTAMVIQLFDIIGGGAGFASSAPQYIQQLIEAMVNNLHCSKCGSSCGDCLLDSNSRHDVDKLNRLVALEWLGVNFLDFNASSDAIKLLDNGKYYSGSIAENIQYHLDHGVDALTLWLSADVPEWDLSSPQFKKTIVRYLTQNEKVVNLVLPNAELSIEHAEEFKILKDLGANFYTDKAAKNEFLVQLIKPSGVITLANKANNVNCPGIDWHRSLGTVVSSDSYSLAELTLLGTSNWSSEVNVGALDVEIIGELNGKLNSFGLAFWTKLLKDDEQLLTLLKADKLATIHYTDRYLQSPAALLLISQLIASMCLIVKSAPKIELEMLFDSKDKQGYLLHHDWQNYDDFKEAYEYWFEYKANVKPNLTMHQKRSDIAHRRKLTLQFESGKAVTFRFDQGVGYWRLNSPSSTVKYQFNADIFEQLSSLKEFESDLMVKNSENWSTDISYKLE